tara:strand:+ start:4425 stop:5933 length:1509 start_codon:yes stop_codon:yes gene_type:complete
MIDLDAVNASMDDMQDIQREQEVQSLLEQSEKFYFNFVPRPDDPANFDEQDSFINEDLQGVGLHIGGNGSGTTEAACCKLSRLLLHKQAPPRRDTPFWVIGESYDQVINAIWNEKLFGHGHIPSCEIDWERVTWYDRKRGLPLTVPLKPWPMSQGGHPNKNWTIEFKSYVQGRAQMQARSIGGFMFSEQFPWDILTEVLRGCREYAFKGAKFCEFTPINPDLSMEIKEMMRKDDLPKNWKIYRANTVKNMEAGHVRPEWLEEFKGMISEEMIATRMTGAFPVFEGLIYPTFSTAFHCVSNLKIPPNCTHRRSIDWGASVEHPFVTLFGCRDGSGRWYIYDEYFSRAQVTSEEHLENIMLWREWPKMNPSFGTTYADPSRPDLLRTFGQKLKSVSPAKNAVYEGIECVRTLLKPGIDGKPMIMIDRERCPELVRTLQLYRWLQSSGRGMNPQSAKPAPRKMDDDPCDALRYLLYSEFQNSFGGFGSMSIRREVPDHLLARSRR